MENTKRCPKYNGEMEKGEMVDDINGGMTILQTWAKKASGLFFIGTKDQKQIVSYRCTTCGYIENYAQ